MPAAYEAADLNRRFSQINERFRAIEEQLAVLSQQAGVAYTAPADEVPPEVLATRPGRRPDGRGQEVP